jgi:hypothetical protein
MKIIGHQFRVDFGAKAILDMQSPTSLVFTILEIDGKPMNETETVEIQLTELRPDLYMATWKEKNGNTVTQIQDHEKGLVYMNWTWPDGQFMHAKGSLRPV